MRYSYRRLLKWVNDPVRTDTEVATCATGLGVPILDPAGLPLTPAQIKTDVRAFINTQPPLRKAAWAPPSAPTSGSKILPIVITIAVLALLVFGLVRFLNRDTDAEGSAPEATATVPVTVTPTATPTTVAVTTPPTTVTPTTVSATVTPTTATPNAATTMECRLVKDGTWSEGNNPHRIEVAGHGTRHDDFYPLVGVKSVSYIVGEILPNEISPIWWGYGSQWSGDSLECADFDWFADTFVYADSRVDSGHSGLVVDLRNGEFEVVYNASNMSQDDIDSLLAQHRAAMQATT